MPTSAWIAIDHGIDTDAGLGRYMLTLKGLQSLYQAIREDDWILVIGLRGDITRVGRVLRSRSNLDTTTLYFDRSLTIDPPVSLTIISLNPPTSGSLCRIQWTDFVEALSSVPHRTIEDIPSIENQAYIRELLQLAVEDDLLGAAGGPHEQIVDMGVRDRYLVGKLAPREAAEKGQEFAVDAANAGSEEPDDLIVKALAKEVDSPPARGKGEAEPSDEIDAASNQSLVPSSLGLTFCVEGDTEQIEVEVRWGRYERSNDHEVFRTRRNKKLGEKDQPKAKVGKRILGAGTPTLPLPQGVFQFPDRYIEPYHCHQKTKIRQPCLVYPAI